MAKLSKYMVVHKDPNISWNKVEENWVKLAKVEKATWERTWFNRKKGVRYCVWLAQAEEVLESIFKELHISYESIMKVEETVPDLWGKQWAKHLKEEETASTKAF